jgi:hypothetical protein
VHLVAVREEFERIDGGEKLSQNRRGVLRRVLLDYSKARVRSADASGITWTR